MKRSGVIKQLMVIAATLSLGACASDEGSQEDLLQEELTGQSDQAMEEGSADEQMADSQSGESFEEIENYALQNEPVISDVAEPITEELPPEDNSPVDTMAADAQVMPPAMPEELPPAQEPEPSDSYFTYITEPGDTLGSIARKVYGDASRFREIAEFNNINNANVIRPGDEIRFPKNAATEAFAAAFKSAPKATVTVQRGDTLSKISLSVMGKRSFWPTLWKMNKDKVPNPNHIMVGQVLTYLASAKKPVADNQQPADKPAEEPNGGSEEQVQPETAASEEVKPSDALPPEVDEATTPDVDQDDESVDPAH